MEESDHARPITKCRVTECFGHFRICLQGVAIETHRPGMDGAGEEFGNPIARLASDAAQCAQFGRATHNEAPGLHLTHSSRSCRAAWSGSSARTAIPEGLDWIGLNFRARLSD